MTTKTRVAITGIGMVTPIGNDTPSTWQALMERKSGIAKIQSFDPTGFATHIAAEVKNFSLSNQIANKKLLRFSTPPMQFALAASIEALADAGLKITEQNSSRWGLVTGSGMMTADFEVMNRFHQRFYHQGELDLTRLGQKGADYFNLDEFARTQNNCGLALLQQLHGIRGYTIAVHTACASGGQALGLGMQTIRRGDSDFVLVGGFDSMINPIGVAGFSLLGALATDNDQPTRASRPFELTRNGFVLGEGAAFLVLEKLDQARKRGAKIYAELAGEGNTLSSYRITDSHPSGDGAIQAIEGALRDAQMDITQIDYINAHGTSTKMNDFSETNAIKAVFKERAYQIPTSSTKSLTGHLISAAGALEGALCALALTHHRLPMTANLLQADPECDLDYITEGPRAQPISAALSNSFGFGGSNSCLIFRNPELFS